jgi:hypothetical protein
LRLHRGFIIDDIKDSTVVRLFLGAGRIGGRSTGKIEARIGRLGMIGAAAFVVEAEAARHVRGHIAKAERCSKPIM